MLARLFKSAEYGEEQTYKLEDLCNYDYSSQPCTLDTGKTIELNPE